MFSATVRLGTSRASWKLRPRPSMARASGDRFVMSTPWNVILPPSGMRKPEMRSKIVVLPAPLGPIRPRISPWRRWKRVSSTARIPPKRLTRPSTSRTTGAVATWLRSRVATAATFSPLATEAPWRNTERTMSSRSRSSAVGPSKRTSPFSMKYARWATVRATLIDCSTRMIAVPDAWMRRTTPSSCSTIVGARPSDSSSIMSSVGFAMNAMPRASICCSPPDRLPAIWSLRSRRRGKIWRTSSLAWARYSGSSR